METPLDSIFTDGRFEWGTQEAYEQRAKIDDGLLFFTTDTLRIYKGTVDYTEFLVVVDELPDKSDAVVGKLYITKADKLGYTIVDGEWIDLIKKTLDLVISTEQPTAPKEGDIWYEVLEDGGNNGG